jgi:thioredoxin reductase/ferredoxin
MQWKQLSILLASYAPIVGVALLGLVAVASVRRRKRAQVEAAKAYRDVLANKLNEPMTLHPEIDPAKCAGCGACVRACPEGDVLRIIDHKAYLVHATKCVGHGQCEVVCPFGAISLVFGTKTRGMDLPRISTDFETNVPGLYIAGELGGMGLIRNAIKQGRLAAEHAAKNLPSAPADYDMLIVGAGAAGLTAALSAIAAKRSYLCIEQNSVGGTIYNFPRQKVVMTQPADLPLVGTMKFPKHKVSKEELLAFWANARRATGLKVAEGCKFLTLDKRGDIFHVETSKGPVTARRVILCMGVRGSPRKLGVPGEETSKVTYNLLDPEQYQRMHIAVVGGGNAAVEAAQYLARPEYKNRVTLLVRDERFDRCNQENQDIIFAMAKKGLVRIAWKTSVKEVHPDHLVVDKDGTRHQLPNHYLFIFAGAELPFKFLESLGIKIEKKFGEPLKRA